MRMSVRIRSMVIAMMALVIVARVQGQRFVSQCGRSGPEQGATVRMAGEDEADERRDRKRQTRAPGDHVPVTPEGGVRAPEDDRVDHRRGEEERDTEADLRAFVDEAA